LLNFCVSKNIPFTYQEITDDLSADVSTALGVLIEKKKLSYKTVGDTSLYWVTDKHWESLGDLQQTAQTLVNEWGQLEKDKKSEPEQIYINILHEYNEMKDSGLLLLGKLAEIEGVPIKKMFEQFDLELDD